MRGEAVAPAVREFFAACSDAVAAVYLFGSYARHRERAASDVDVGVLFRTTPESTLEGLPLDYEDALERVIGRPVHVVSLNSAPVDLRKRVLRDGALLVDADPALRIRFEVATRNEAFDLEPILEAYRRARGHA